MVRTYFLHSRADAGPFLKESFAPMPIRPGLAPVLRAAARTLLLALPIAAAFPAAARPLDLEGRRTPVHVRDDGKLAAQGRTPTDAVPSLRLTAEFQLVMNEAKLSYALLVPAPAPARVLVNGRDLGLDPIVRAEGYLYKVSDWNLRSGANTIQVERTELAPWNGLLLFSLDGTAEDVHFGRHFAEPDPADRASSTGTRASPAKHSSQDNYDIRHYDMYIYPDMATLANPGWITSATVTVTARSLINGLVTVGLDFQTTLDSANITISRVDSGPGTSALSYSLTQTASNKWLIVTLPSAANIGDEFKIRVGYSGRTASGGSFGNGFIVANKTGPNSPTGRVLYTFNEPYKARKWFPCKDLPDDKADDGMSIRVRVDQGFGRQVVTAGKLQSITDNGDSTETWHWEHNYPIVTYLLAICISNYSYVSSTYTALDNVTTMPIRHAIYPENIGLESGGAAGTLEVMDFMAQLFGEYPFLDEKYYTATHNSGSGMEHQTNTSMPPGDVQDGRQRRNVHELAHHWYGDKVTCRTFEHLWINEGFATYAEALWEEHRFGTAPYHSLVNSWTVSHIRPVVGPDSDTFSGGIVYRKGGWILHMLRKVMGDTAFFTSIRRLHEDHAYSTVVSSDFQVICEQESGLDLNPFFTQWLYWYDSLNAGQPTYYFTGTLVDSMGGNQTTIQVVQTQSGSAYQMPIEIEGVDHLGNTQRAIVQNTTKNQALATNWGTFRPIFINLDPDNWILKTRAFSMRSVGVPKATVGQPYSHTLSAVNGTTPYVWQAVSSLPAGLSLSAGGVLSGTPTSAGTFAATIRATDNNGSGTQRNASINIVIDASSVEDWPQH